MLAGDGSVATTFRNRRESARQTFPPCKINHRELNVPARNHDDADDPSLALVQVRVQDLRSSAVLFLTTP
jgi:hypothetical protein